MTVYTLLLIKIREVVNNSNSTKWYFAITINARMLTIIRNGRCARSTGLLRQLRVLSDGTILVDTRARRMYSICKAYVAG